MLFPSEVFLFLFLPIVVCLYYGVFIKYPVGKNIFLFIVSLLFYAYGEPVYVFLMLFMIFTHYFFGLLIERYKNNNSYQKLVITGMVFLDILILGYYKYAGFIVDNINSLFSLDLNLLGGGER